MAVPLALPLVNQSNLEKIESFINDTAYREALESSANYNTRLCLERKLRMPFLDSQTGVAQNHSQLFMSKRQRMPGLHPGQIYSYPRARWRKKRRQYLTLHSRVLARAADAILDSEGDLHSISQVENPALQDTDSKDSQLLKDEVPKEWFYDEQDMLEMEGYDEPDADSDFDYEESHSSRRRKRGKHAGKVQTDVMDKSHQFMTNDRVKDIYVGTMEGKRGRGRPRKCWEDVGEDGLKAKETRGVDSPNTPRRGKGSGRGRKKANHGYDPLPGDSDKPFACERTPTRRGRQPANAAQPPPQPQVPLPTLPQTLPPQSQAPSSQQPPALQPPPLPQPVQTMPDDPPMPVLVPEKKIGTPPGPGGKPPPCIPQLGGPTDPPVVDRPSEPNADRSKIAPNPYCDFCLGDARENKKTGMSEELVTCSDCGRSGHPSCLQFTANMIISVRKYRWQCIECKCCSVCGTSDNDDQLLFCDDCDRGYHMYCLAPPLTTPPEGSWSCKLCIVEFHK